MADRRINKFDTILEKLHDIDKKLEVYNYQLQIHMQRTEQNELAIEEMMQSLTEFKAYIKVIHKLLALGGAVAGLVLAALKLVL